MAWAVVETENAETCTWFLKLLVDDLKSVARATSWVQERGDPVTFMRDRQKVLPLTFYFVIQ